MKEIPIAKKIWDCASTHEAKIDIARLVFLYLYGGVSVDLDLIPTQQTLRVLYEKPRYEYLSEHSLAASKQPRIVASTKRNVILYTNLIYISSLQYRQHVINKKNLDSYKDSRWKIYSGSWLTYESFPKHGRLPYDEISGTGTPFLKFVNISKESSNSITLNGHDQGIGCVDFNKGVQKSTDRNDMLNLIKMEMNKTECDDARLVYINDNIIPDSLEQRKIPLVIHMTARSRCVTQHVKKYVDEWKNIPNYSYILHDDGAIKKLFQNYEWNEFPLLKYIQGCLSNGAMKADIWRYLILWKFGGVYTDIDNGIGQFFNRGDFIKESTDALFEVEKGGFPSQYFFAVSPNHPIMYFALSIAIERLIDHSLHNTGRTFVVTGPNALKIATIAQTNSSNGYLSAGTYMGKSNRSLTIIGSRNHAKYRLFIARDHAKDNKNGHLMKMPHYFGDVKTISKFLPQHTCQEELIRKEYWKS